MSNSNHSDAWHSVTSRGNRLQRKLGAQRLDLTRLEQLLRGDKVPEPDPYQDEGGEA